MSSVPCKLFVVESRSDAEKVERSFGVKFVKVCSHPEHIILGNYLIYILVVVIEIVVTNVR